MYCVPKIVQVSAASRMVRFFVNGIDQGVAFGDLPLDTPLYAAANLKGDYLGSALVYNVRNITVLPVLNPAVNLVRECF